LVFFKSAVIFLNSARRPAPLGRVVGGMGKVAVKTIEVGLRVEGVDRGHRLGSVTSASGWRALEAQCVSESCTK